MKNANRQNQQQQQKPNVNYIARKVNANDVSF